MKIILTIISMVIITIPLSSCYVIEPINEDIIMPLAVGNYWVYDIISYDDSIPEGTTVISIDSDTSINNVRWYIESRQMMLTNKNNGLWDRAMNLSTSKTLFLKYPGRPGEQWNRHVNEGGYRVNVFLKIIA